MVRPCTPRPLHLLEPLFFQLREGRRPRRRGWQRGDSRPVPLSPLLVRHPTGPARPAGGRGEDPASPSSPPPLPRPSLPATGRH